MDRTTSIVLVVAVVVLSIVAVSALLRYQRTKVSMKGPLGMGLNIQSENPLAPGTGALIEDARSRTGGAEAVDSTGRGATLRRVEVDRDLRASSSNPGAGADPKA